jgi:glycosyltransferase involved in cell wall biosynthesis
VISLIIPTRNRADLLNGTLKSILNQDISFSEFEIIVSDNGSNDNTAEIINKYKDQLVNLRKIYVSEPGLHNARHAGVKVAKGNILVFADDDIEALPTWLSSINETFKDSEVVMVGGNNYPLFLQPAPVWLKQMWKKKTFGGHRFIPELSICEFNPNTKRISPSVIWGCNFSIRKNILLEAGGFHPDGMPKNLIKFRGDGETHISKYVSDKNLICMFNKGASIFHKVTAERMTIEYFYERSFNQGISNSYSKLRELHCRFYNKKLNFFKLENKLFEKLRFYFKKFFADKIEKKIIDARQKGYRDGFFYHQNLYLNDSEIRNWVHKVKYF